MPVLRYFWFLCAAVLLVNLLVWRGRLPQLVSRGTVTQEEVARFLRGAAFWMVTPCVLLGAIALWGGWSSPLCARPFSFRDAPTAATSLVIWGCWAALLAWVWLGRGADLLGRIGPVLMAHRARYDLVVSPTVVRAVVTAIVLVAGIAGAVVQQQRPMEAGLCGPIEPHAVAVPEARTGS